MASKQDGSAKAPAKKRMVGFSDILALNDLSWEKQEQCVYDLVL